MARETLKDFLSSQGLGADSISYTVRDDNGDGTINKGDDLGVDPNTGKELLDLSSADVGILGDYLNFIQQNADVVFGVKPGNEEAISAIRGNPLSHPENQGAERVFVEMGTSTAESITLIQNSNSGKFDQDDVKLVDIVDKIEGRSGHTLLPGISGKDMGTDGNIYAGSPRPYPATPEGDREKQIVNASVNILRESNRFTPAGSASGNPYVNGDESSSDFNLKDTLTVQREFGEFDGDSFNVRMAKLEAIGRSLLSESGGFLDTEGNEVYPEKNLSSTVPVEKIGRHDLRAKNVDGFPQILDLNKSAQINRGNSIIRGESARSGRGDFLTLGDTENSTSFGSMTKDGDQSFNPANKQYLRARAAIAVKTALVAIDSFKQVALESAEGAKKVRSSRGPYLMGENQQYVRTGVSFIMNSILVPTDNGYKKAVNKGAKFLLGIDKNLGEINEENADDLTSKIESKSRLVKTSPGYTLVLARSILLAVHSLQKDVFQNSTFQNADDANELIRSIGKSRIVGLLNTFAIIGDIALNLEKSKAGIELGLSKSRGMWDVDSMPDGPATRVSKSRTSDGFNQSALSMRTSATPSMYLLPKGVIRAGIKMGTSAKGVNPAKAMLGSTIAQQTFTGDAMTGGARIPKEVVKTVENMLDAEYMPFYFHDLRTNEIISFHAFLSDLTDDYTAEFSETAGYGRMDAVQTYKGTKRGMGFGFTIAATSQEDFDEMWWKINKLTTLVYPQWTEGDLLATADHGKFIQPFSQVIGASPLVRVRIGDVVKSNYSKFNLSRIFGIGGFDVKPELPAVGFGLFNRGGGLDLFGNIRDILSEIALTAFLVAYGSPLGHSITDFIPAGSAGASIASSPIATKIKGAIMSSVSNMLVNGFASPLLNSIISRYKDPDNDPGALDEDTPGYRPGKSSFITGLGTVVFVKANNTSKPYTLLSANGEDLNGLNTLRFSRPVKCIVLSRSRKTISGRGRGGDASPNDKSRKKTFYKLKVIDTNVPPGIMGAELRVTHSDIHHDPSDTFNRYMLPILDPFGGVKAGLAAIVNKKAENTAFDGIGDSITMTTAGEFMDSANNSVTRAFESTQGRGLAGVIKNLKFTWLDDNTPWEIDWGSRAPMLCKVSITFAPIHDLPPGLDSEGYNRAPIYNVGRIMRYAGGDPHNDNGAASEAVYQSAHRKTFKKE